MRAELVALSLLVVLFAGCVQTVEDPLSGIDEDEEPALPDGVSLFGGNGTQKDGAEKDEDEGNGTPGNGTAAALPELGTPWANLTGFSGAEPTMAITASGTILGAAGNAGIRSKDGGETWDEVIRIGLPIASPADSAYRSWDPLMWHDKWTDTVYFDPMFPPLACTELSWTEDDGDTWNRQPPACHPPPMDHQKLFSGPPGPDAPPLAGVLHPTVLYQCYNQLLATQCGISYDGGLSWPVTSKAAAIGTDPCGGINGHGVVSESGVVALPLSSCADMHVAISHDSGLTWSLFRLPGTKGVASFDPDVVFDEDENLFVLWRGDDHQTYLARSADLGTTWEGPFDVTPPSVASTFFHTMNHGADGRLAMAFLGEETHGGNPNDAPAETRWHLYIVTTEDRFAANPEFVSYQVSPDDDPVHLGLICTGGVGCETGRDLLEFIDSAVSPAGTFHVIYTDSCGPKCAEDDDLNVNDKDGRHVGLARLDDWPMRSFDEVAVTAEEQY